MLISAVHTILLNITESDGFSVLDLTCDLIWV